MKVITVLGQNGTEGSGLDPLQFGNVADVATDDSGNVWISDGDGGINNRVLQLKNDSSLGVARVIDGSNGAGVFSSPHSITYQKHGDLIWVADRGNNRTQTFRASNGDYVGSWACFRGIENSQKTDPIAPWGLRIDQKRNELVMAADTTSGARGHLLRLDLSAATEAARSDDQDAFEAACNVVQDIAIGWTAKSHELAIDQRNGDVYLVRSSPNSYLNNQRTHKTPPKG